MKTLEDIIDLTSVPGGFVFHFLSIISDEESNSVPNSLDRVPTLYRMALNKAYEVGGEKYHNKSFGGGIYLHGTKQNVLKKINKIMEA